MNEWTSQYQGSCWRTVFRWPCAVRSVWSPSVCRCAWWRRTCTSWSERTTGSHSRATSETHGRCEEPSPQLTYDHLWCYLNERGAVAHGRSFIPTHEGRLAGHQRRDQIQQIADRVQELNGKLGQRLQRETRVNVWSERTSETCFSFNRCKHAAQKYKYNE